MEKNSTVLMNMGVGGSNTKVKILAQRFEPPTSAKSKISKNHTAGKNTITKIFVDDSSKDSIRSNSTVVNVLSRQNSAVNSNKRIFKPTIFNTHIPSSSAVKERKCQGVGASTLLKTPTTSGGKVCIPITNHHVNKRNNNKSVLSLLTNIKDDKNIINVKEKFSVNTSMSDKIEINDSLRKNGGFSEVKISNLINTSKNTTSLNTNTTHSAVSNLSNFSSNSIFNSTAPLPATKPRPPPKPQKPTHAQLERVTIAIGEKSCYNIQEHTIDRQQQVSSNLDDTMKCSNSIENSETLKGSSSTSTIKIDHSALNPATLNHSISSEFQTNLNSFNINSQLLKETEGTITSRTSNTPKAIQRPKIKPPPPKPKPVNKSIELAEDQRTAVDLNSNVSTINKTIVEEKTSIQSRGVVRKPSLRPPPPPLTSEVRARKSIAFPLDITLHSSPLILPRMPPIPPPSPPNDQSKNIDDETFEQVYEEIKEHQINVSSISPSNCIITNDNDNEKYVPKFRKKSASSIRHSPPDYYHRNICHQIQQQNYSFDILDKDSNMLNSTTLPTEFRRNSQRIQNNFQDDDDSDQNQNEQRRASYRRARFQRHGCGRFDTCTPIIPSLNIASSSNNNSSTSNFYFDCRHLKTKKNEFEFENVSSFELNNSSRSTRFSTSSKSGTHRPLSEFLRFKSELQLHLSKKMNQLCTKVENTVGANASRSDFRRRSIFYVDQLDGTDEKYYEVPGDELIQNEQKTLIELQKTQKVKSQQQQQKSLLDEIESAYIELERRRENQTTSTVRNIEDDYTTALSLEVHPQACAPSHLTQNAKWSHHSPLQSSILQLPMLEKMASHESDNEGSVIHAAESYDKRHNVKQLPSSSTSLSSSTSSSLTSITDSSEMSPTIIDANMKAVSLPSSPVLTSSASFLPENNTLHTIVLNIPENGESLDGDDELSTDKNRNTYKSMLPAPQPLYQHYLKQEQARLYGLPSENAMHAQVRDNSTVFANDTKNEVIPTKIPNALVSFASPSTISEGTLMQDVPNKCLNEKKNEAKKIINVSVSISNATTAMIEELNEVDSVCDFNSNEDAGSVCIRRQSSSVSTDSGRGADTLSHVTSSNTSMRRERLTAGSVYGSQRSLWCELPEVRSAGLLDALDKHSKRLQEAYFEVITSEASYLNSMNVLVSNFMAAPELLGTKSSTSIISSVERKQLFSNVQAIRDCSEHLLCDLEERLKENIVLSDVCDILCEHFEKHFDAYVKYCSNQVYQDRTLRRLKHSNTAFVTSIQRLEANRQCQGLDMRSFLMLPMQRVTRYPLLLYAILESLEPGSGPHEIAKRAYLLANQIVRNCDEGARRMERTEQLLEIESKLIYKSADLKRLPLVSSGRYVVKHGLVTQLIEPKSSRSKLNVLQSRTRTHTRCLYLFLFNDLLMITRRKPNETHVCKDYAVRRFIEIQPVEPHSNRIPAGAIEALKGEPHLFFCTLMVNARGKQVELLLNAATETDRERWLSAIRPPTCANPDEKIYAEWDCPQAVVVHNYEVSQEDELELLTGDIINILRKMPDPDGWFYGERIRDSKGGWFPSSYVQLIMNDHVRTNNYRQRQRLIQNAFDCRLQQQGTIRERRTGNSKRASLPASALLNASASFSAVNGVADVSPRIGAHVTNQENQIMTRLRRLSNPRSLFLTTNE